MGKSLRLYEILMFVCKPQMYIRQYKKLVTIWKGWPMFY